MEITLVFVYNSDGGLFNGLRNWAHKIVAPSTYPCSLHALSYGTLGIHSEWRSFVDSLPVGTRFYHRDEFHRRYGKLQEPLPAVFLQVDNQVEVWITTEDLKRLNILDELIILVRRKLAATLDERGWTSLKVSA